MFDTDAKTGQNPADLLHSMLESDAFENFCGEVATKADGDKIVSITYRIEPVDPLACVEVLGREDTFNFYWEKPDRDLAFGAGGEVIRLRSGGDNRILELKEQIEEVQKRTHHFSPIQHRYGGIHFLGGGSFFDQIEEPIWKGFGAFSLTVPEWLFIRDGKLGLLTLTARKDRGLSTEQLKRHFLKMHEQLLPALNMDRDEVLERSMENGWILDPDGEEIENRWMKMVDEVKQEIRQASFEKIVLARRFTARSKQPISPTLMLNRLRNQYHNCYSFLIHQKNSGTFIGSTPERLAYLNNRLLLTDGLAGSISRGESATEDALMEKQLLNSPKNLREHRYVVRSIARNLQPFSKNVDYPDRPGVKKLRNVQHLFTPITAYLKEESAYLDIISSLHPTPAVGGYPRKQALDYIRRFEEFDRGWYAGPVGWLNLNRCGEFSVAIRSGIIKDDTAHFYAGCGILSDSDPVTEWKESQLKFMPMVSAMNGHG